jgi:sRNA-binding protein
MGLSHPSGTLEKKKKKVKEKKRKKRKEKKENAPGGQMKRKTHWVSRRKRTIGVCVFFFSFGLSCTSLSCLLSCLSPSLQQQHQGTRITSATVSVP